MIRDIAGPVPLRLYDAREERGPGPVLLFIHGGGWVLGDLDTHEPFCIEMAIELDIPVVAVDYRLAPEYPFPAAVEDSIAAARWVASGRQALGRKATGLFLAGDSAGGNLRRWSRSAARRTGSGAGRRPVADLSGRRTRAVPYPSYDQFCEGHLLTRRHGLVRG